MSAFHLFVNKVRKQHYLAQQICNVIIYHRKYYQSQNGQEKTAICFKLIKRHIIIKKLFDLTTRRKKEAGQEEN